MCLAAHLAACLAAHSATHLAAEMAYLVAYLAAYLAACQQGSEENREENLEEKAFLTHYQPKIPNSHPPVLWHIPDGIPRPEGGGKPGGKPGGIGIPSTLSASYPHSHTLAHTWRHAHARKPSLVQHRVIGSLSLRRVRVRDTVDDALRFLMPDLLVVIYDVAQVVAAGVVRFAHAHGVVGEVDIAVVAEEFGHGCGALGARVCGGGRRSRSRRWSGEERSISTEEVWW